MTKDEKADRPRRRGAWPIVALAAIALGGLAFVYGKAAMDGGVGTRANAGDATLVAEGRAVYAQHCAECHGAKLEGQPNWQTRNPDGTFPAPPHDPSGHTWHHPDRVLFAIAKDGGQRHAPQGFKSGMPPFAGTLSDREIWASLAYIKSTWPDDIRKKHAQIDRAGAK